MICFIGVILLLQTLLVTAAPWVVTSYIEIDLVTIAAEPGVTQTIAISNFVTPTASTLPPALSIVTISDQNYSELDVVEIILPSGAGAPMIPNNSTVIETDFYVPVTYHPFSTCSGKKWTYITTVSVYVPLPAQPFLTPLATSTSITSFTVTVDDTLQVEASTTVTALLDPSDIPSDEYSSISSENQPGGVELCTSPTETKATVSASATGAVSTYGITCGNDNPTCEDCTYYTEYCYGDCAPVVGTYLECTDGKKYWITGGPSKKHINARAAAIATPVVWGGLWFVIGIWNHLKQFREVMQGREGNLGGLPVPWACCTLCVSVFFIGRHYLNKTSLEQERLAEQWKGASWWKKVWWYFRWGWGWKYPPMLGTRPAVTKKAGRGKS